MARRTNRSKSKNRNTRLNSPKPTTPRVRFSLPRSRPLTRHPLADLLSPTPVTRGVTKKSKPQPIRQQPVKNKYAAIRPADLSHVSPAKITVCKKRVQRKQLAHALGFAGKAGQKKPDMTTAKTKC